MSSLWIDIYRPKILNELSIHPLVTSLLSNFAKSFNFPNILFSGPPGSGKKTRVLAFLRQLFNVKMDTLKNEYSQIEFNDKTIEVHVISSHFHIEITPSDYGNYDRHIITHFIKSAASIKNIHQDGPKIIVLNEANLLTKLAQQALRRLMEKYSNSCRFVLIADSLSQLIDPIRSRCFIIRTPRVSDNEVFLILRQIANSEQLDFNDDIFNYLTQIAEGDLRIAIVCLERLSIIGKLSSDPLTQVLPEYERYIEDLCNIVVMNQHNSETLKKIRGHFYELLIHCIPPSIIFKTVLRGLLKKIDPFLVPAVCEAGAIYEARMHQGQKAIFHLEAFAARFIFLYQEYINN
jgi:replication factor C subunit 3/5